MVQFLFVLVIFDYLVKCSGMSPPSYIIELDVKKGEYQITLRENEIFTVEVNTHNVNITDDIFCLGPDKRNDAISKTSLKWITEKNRLGLPVPDNDNNELVATPKLRGVWTCNTFNPYKEYTLIVDVIKQSLNVCVAHTCGPHAICTDVKNRANCTCLPNTIGEPPHCNSECLEDKQCSHNKACVGRICVNPCSKCGENTECTVMNHIPSCICKSEYYGDPKTGCTLPLNIKGASSTGRGPYGRHLISDTGSSQGQMSYIDTLIYNEKNTPVHETKSVLIFDTPYQIRLHISSDLNISPSNIKCFNKINKGDIYINQELIQTGGPYYKTTTVYLLNYTADVIDPVKLYTAQSWICVLWNAFKNTIAHTFSFKIQPKPAPPTTTTPRYIATTTKKVTTKKQTLRTTTILPRTTTKKEKTTTEPAGTERRAEVFVNNKKINMKDKEAGIYRYRAGELATVSCRKNKGMIHAGFYRADTLSQLLTIDSTYNYSMTMKLTNEHNGKTFSCSILLDNYSNEKYHTIEVKFEMEIINTDINNPEIKVNGLILVPDNTIYTYEYYDGETLRITGSTSNKDSRWNCKPTQYNKQLSPITNQPYLSEMVTLNHTDNTIYINCIVGEYVVNITLVPATAIIDPSINGLSSAHMLYAYSNATSTMVYQNPGHKQLTLICINKGGDSQKYCSWSYTSNEVINITITKNILEYSLKDASSNLMCTCQSNMKQKNRKSTQLVIYNVKSEPEDIFTTPGVESTTLVRITEQPSHSGNIIQAQPDETDSSLLLLLGIICGTIFVVVIVLWIIIGIHKRKRRLEQEQASNINYENLPAHNEGTMPTPAVWDQYSLPLHTEDPYTYCDPQPAKNIKDAKQKLKNRRQPVETEYAEVGVQNEVNYASITPKGQNEPLSEYANLDEPAYSQIQPKRLRDKGCTPQVLPKMDEYARVLPKSVRNQGAPKYDNLFESQRYANAPTKSDYAEPAYCEVNKEK